MPMRSGRKQSSTPTSVGLLNDGIDRYVASVPRWQLITAPSVTATALEMAYVQPELADAVRHAGACLGLDVAALERLSEPARREPSEGSFDSSPSWARSRQ